MSFPGSKAPKRTSMTAHCCSLLQSDRSKQQRDTALRHVKHRTVLTQECNSTLSLNNWIGTVCCYHNWQAGTHPYCWAVIFFILFFWHDPCFLCTKSSLEVDTWLLLSDIPRLVLWLCHGNKIAVMCIKRKFIFLLYIFFEPR